MRKALTAILLTMLATSAGTARVDACGDKFLLVGRALKYQEAYKAAHPATIVLYETPNSHVATVARALDLQRLLTSAGHKVHVASTPASLDEIMTAHRADLVVVDGDQASQIEATARRTGTKMLPVLDHADRKTVAAAEKQFGVVLQASTKNRHPLAIFDEALKSAGKSAARS